MSFNAAALKLMLEKGLTLSDVAEIAEANERRRDSTGAERQQRYRDNRKRNAVTSRVTPPNDKDILTPREVSEAKASSPQPWALPVGVSLQVWTDFLGNRKRKRLGNTETAWKAFIDDLTRIAALTGIPPPKLIEHAAAKGWGGIYDPRDKRDERPNDPTTAALQRIIGANG